MNFITTNNLHHAYLIEGERETGNQLICELEKSGIKCVGSANFYRFAAEKFGIDDAHAIKSFQSNKSGDSKMIIIIESLSFSLDAQNALLKVLEEPTVDTHFFIITSNKDNLLPTIQSRVQSIKSENQSFVNLDLAKKFFKASIKERLDIVKDMVEEYKDDEDASKSVFFDFLNSLESLLHESTKGQEMTKINIQKFEEIMKCRKYMSGSGASVKMLLENLALVV